MPITIGWESQGCWPGYNGHCRSCHWSTDARGLDKIRTSACYQVRKEQRSTYLVEIRAAIQKEKYTQHEKIIFRSKLQQTDESLYRVPRGREAKRYRYVRH